MNFIVEIELYVILILLESNNKISDDWQLITFSIKLTKHGATEIRTCRHVSHEKPVLSISPFI